MVTVLFWSFGVITGISIFLLTTILFYFKLILTPKSGKQLPKFIKPPQLSKEVINEIKLNLNDSEAKVAGYTTDTRNEVELYDNSVETVNWLNGIVNWLFLNLSESSHFQTSLKQIISEILVDLRRSPLGLVLTETELEALNLSGSSPTIKSVQIITKTPLSLKVDLEYEGILRVLSNLKTIFGFNLKIETLIEKFSGSFCLVIQDRTIHFSFLKAPNQIETKTRVAIFSNSTNRNIQIPLLNSLISNEKLIRTGISIGPCFPTFLGQWYRAGPKQPPYPWDSSVKENPEKLYNWAE